MSKQARVNSVDILRGAVMVIMALDHVRDFFHSEAMLGDPLNLSTTTPALFFTRWVTHFCAPVFVFLAGTSAYLSGLNKTPAQLSGFLISRGLWLIVVELVLMSLILTFNPAYNLIVLSVIWAIGISMIILGLLVRLPYAVILTIGLTIVFGHNLLDTPEALRQGRLPAWWQIVHGGPGVIPLSKTHMILVAYSFLPWTGIMLTGYAAGKLFGEAFSPARRTRLLWMSGLGLILLFIAIRWSNLYGNPTGWSIQRNGLFTLFSFLNVNKYPPSLLFTCITLGPALIALSLLEHTRNRLASFFVTYGRVPFFYFILHFLLIRLAGVVAFFIAGYGVDKIISPPFFFRPAEFGYGLGGVYLVWISIVLLLYPLCRWYGKYKQTHKHWWLSYL
jgi:uncharacterized membrane protein